jgi:uncharacterized coiled-coil protein SlyX
VDDRISLEEKLAWLEHHVGELDGVVRGLASQVAELEMEVARLRAARADGGDTAAPEPGAFLLHEKPPHY